jgi:ribosomal protein L29
MSEKKKVNYHEYSLIQLADKKKELETTILKLRVQAAGTVMKNIRALRYTRRELARVLTITLQKEKLEQNSRREG